jgi:alanyl-tRNA synthetase
MTKLDLWRQKFLTFYQDRQHTIIPSASLIPENDASTLFTSSGMQPLVNYFLGAIHPGGKRIADCQKCFRANDLEEVGDNRHTTFFEMLGNWSFGDYFKQKQLGWVFEFFTQIVGLDPARLYVTVFAGEPKLNLSADTKSISLWQSLFASVGLKAEVGTRIFLYDAHKNWWSRSGTPEQMPAGEPGGGDSEIFFDFGAQLGLHQASPWANQPCHPNCDCGRFIEIGNSVFMEYQKTAAGKFVKLPQANVDYGGGLERLIMAAEDQPDIFLTSIFTPLKKALEKASQKKYAQLTQSQRSDWRIIMDHTRSATMLLSEKITPSNKEQGYVLRRLIRRALVCARQAKLPSTALTELALATSKIYAPTYPELKQITKITTELTQEIARFEKTLTKGLSEITKLKKVDGAAAFYLYETYGFPWELTKEIVAERGESLDETAFLQAKKAHQLRSRAQSEIKFKGGLADANTQTIKFHTATHLLLAALKKSLDPAIKQKGSNITSERARFDFNFSRPLTATEITVLEKQINTWIKDNLLVQRREMPKTEALALVGDSGFSDRYPDQVSVYQIGDVSAEICIGPHVERTGAIKHIKLEKEQSAGAGIRRLYLTISRSKS